MTARDDYPQLAAFAEEPSGRDVRLIARRREAAATLDELDRLRHLARRVRYFRADRRFLKAASAPWPEMGGGA